MSTVDVLRTRLAQAEDAFHRLSIGEHVVWVTDHNGEQVRYQRADATQLRRYIQELQVEIARLEGQLLPNGPMRVWM